MSESDDKITVRSDPLGMLDTAKQLAASGITGPIGSIGNLASALSFPGTWKRIGLGALGIWLCWLGVLLILSQTAVVKNAVGAITSVATKGVVKP